MPLRPFATFALLLVLAGCQTGEPEEALESAIPAITPSAPPQQFSYTSPSQTRYNPFSVEIWSQPSPTGAARSYVRVAASGIRIGSPTHEAVARAVVVEVASERLCTGGTVPTFQQQYGREVYLNERVEKWDAIISCEAPSYAPAPVAGAGAYPVGPEDAGLGAPSQPLGSTPGVFSTGQAPLPPAPIGSTQF